MDLELGDLVLLRSGGAICTVIETYETQVEVAWSDGKHNYQSTYPRAALRKIEVTELGPQRSGAAH
jgi:hypothetical protein